MLVLTPQSPPERRWLAHLARAAAGAIRAGDRFDDDLPLDAEALRALARRHRLTPLLWRGLATARVADPLPSVLTQTLRRDYYATLRKNVIALEGGAQLLRRLADAGVEAAPLKGWALVEGPRRVYEDAGERPMDDLDLVVARSDVPRAEAELAAIGFAPVGTRRAARLAGGHEMAFHRRVAGIDCFVELHWAWAGSESLMRGFAVPGEVFLREGCEPCAGGPGRVPTATAHVLFLAVHAARHAFSRWIWLLDLHRSLEAAPPDWAALVRDAARLRARRPLYVGLAAARELFRTPVPKEVLQALAPGPVRRRLLHRSLAPEETPAPRRRERMAKLLLGESWWDVARTAAWAARPGRAWYARRDEKTGIARRLRHPLRVLADRPEGPQ